jgi:single-strand DNA-binding protein
MAGYNLAVVVGNLTKDPELRYTGTGTAVCNFTVAVNSKRKKDDEWVEETEYVHCVAWKKTAEAVAQYCSKGKSVLVSGALQTRSWERDGIKRYKTEIVANVVQFLGSKGEVATPDEVSDIEPF